MTETPLTKRIKRQIATSGPISVAAFMTQCLSDPDHGYYTTQAAIGAEADFITAPEVSQMFGELVGIWILSAWQQAGSPRPFRLVELGPGRGTLMRDMVRTIRSAVPALDSLEIHLVEISQHLSEKQNHVLSSIEAPLHWHKSIADLPKGPLFLVANEFFDCMPINQWVLHHDKWHERVVGLDDKGALSFGIGAIKDLIVPSVAPQAAQGAIKERSPASEAAITEIASKLALEGGAGLIIDYGYAQPGLGDTLQALRHHKYVDPLTAPGRQDLTAHVDFTALGNAARLELAQRNCVTHHVTETKTQGEFLLSLGLLERAGHLGHGKTRQEQDHIHDAVERLAGPDQMGALFKCLAIKPRDTQLPPFQTGDAGI